METHEVVSRRRNQRCQLAQQLGRREHEVGAPGARVAQAVSEPAIGELREPLEREGRSRPRAAQPLESLAIVLVQVGGCVEGVAEQERGETLLGERIVAHGEHGLYGGGVVGRLDVAGLGLREQRAQHAFKAAHERGVERVQLVIGGRADGGEADHAVRVAHEDAVRNDDVEVDVEVERVAEALDERHRAASRVTLDALTKGASAVVAEDRA